MGGVTSTTNSTGMIVSGWLKQVNQVRNPAAKNQQQDDSHMNPCHNPECL